MQIAVLLLITIIVSYGFWECLQQVLRGYKSKKWPSVKGTITSFTFEEHSKRDHTRISYLPKVHYDFIVESDSFSGNTFNFSGLLLNKDEMEEMKGMYNEGDKVDVYFDPDNPQMSVLTPGIAHLAIPFMLIALLFTCIFGLGFIFSVVELFD
ncbi:MAG: DUF3592 domain-containing protein [Lentisphaeraceae bacterium]|nr:DUF3592 domain-containing protein [Lentisphaeraceae bacterium]